MQRRFKPRKRICSFCADKSTNIDYKDINKLKKYITERGKILPRRVSGNCSKHQRELTISIKRSRQVALLPYSAD
jgi:small subunit ribosomal protein S18